MNDLSRRGFLAAGGAATAALALTGCGLIGPKQALTKGTPTPKGTVLKADYLHAESGYATLPKDSGAKPIDVVFRTPHFGMTFAQVQTYERLDSVVATTLRLEYSKDGYAPAPGHEFLAVEFTAGKPPYEDVDGSTRYAFIVDGEERSVDFPFGGWNEVLQRYEQRSAVYVISVPKEKPVLFQVSDAGKQAKLDVRTGEPVKDADTDACAPFSKLGAVTITTKEYEQQIKFTTDPPAGVKADSGSLELDYKLGEATLGPWSPGAGWAAPGRAALQVSVAMTCYDFTGPDMNFNPKDVFAVTAGGKRCPCTLNKPINLRKDVILPTHGLTVACTFDVPAETTSVDFTIDNKSPVVMQYKQFSDVKTHDDSRSAPFTTNVSFAVK